MLAYVPTSDPVEMANLTEDEKKRLDRLERFRKNRGGYAEIQSTRPQTLSLDSRTHRSDS